MRKAIWIGVVAFILVLPASASTSQKDSLSLNPSERNSVRYHLENLYNEMDLLIRNQKVDARDIQRQERELRALRVYERIPFQRNIAALKRELIQTSSRYQLQIIQLKLIPVKQKPRKIPNQIYSDTPHFNLTDDQLAELIPFEMTVMGSWEQVKNWVHSWAQNQLRWVELDAKDESKAISKLKDNKWNIFARSFRFRNVKFPTLLPRNPKNLLPPWAQKNLKAFSKSEPLLWNFVKRIENLYPKAVPYYKQRERFLLNDARMNFFLSKAMKP